MQKKTLITAIAIAGLAMAMASSSAHALMMDYTAGPGLGIPLVDDAYDGTLGSMSSSTIVIGDSGVVDGLTVEFALEHTWVGDLVIKLQGPDLTLITLTSRPGFDELADDGTDCCGNSGNSSIGVPVTYDDSAATPAESWNGSGGPGGPFAPNDPLAMFVGSSLAGSWTFYIGDSAEFDFGTLDGWSLHVEFTESVPEPGTLALLGLGLVGLGFARKRQH